MTDDHRNRPLPLALVLALAAACHRGEAPRATASPHPGTGSQPAVPPALVPDSPVPPTIVPATDREIAREITFTTDPKTQAPRMISPRPGVDIPVSAIWRRYARILRVPPDEIVQAGPPRPSSTRAGYMMTFYGQVHSGYQVSGYGYLVDSENGLFREATGKIMPDLPASLPKPIDRAAAMEAALRYLKLDGPPPWEAPPPPPPAPNAGPQWMQVKPHAWHPPEGWLGLSTGRVDPVGSDFFLAWVFTFSGSGLTGPSAPGTMEIDAATGRVLWTSPGRVH